MQSESVGLEQRVLVLERQIATLRGALAFAGLVGAGGAGMAAWAVAQHHAMEDVVSAPAAGPSELRVRALTVVDAADQPRAELGVAADGTVALSLRAPDGASRLALQANAQRAGLSTFGERDLQRSWVGWSFDEERGDRSELQLLDRGGRLRLGAQASDGVPGLVLYNESGVTVDAFPR